MNYILNTIKTVIGVLWIAFCVGVVVINYRPAGLLHLGLQFLGIAGIIVALFIYNQKHK